VQVLVFVCVLLLAEVRVAAIHETDHEVELLERLGVQVGILGLVVELLPVYVRDALRVRGEVQRAQLGRLVAAAELRKCLDVGVRDHVFAEVLAEPGRVFLVLLEVGRDPWHAQRHREHEDVGVAVCHGACVLVRECVHLEVPILREHGRLDAEAVELREFLRLQVEVEIDEHEYFFAGELAALDVVEALVERAAASVYAEVGVQGVFQLEGLVFLRVDVPVYARENAHEEGDVSAEATAVAHDAHVALLDAWEAIQKLENAMHADAEELHV